MRSRTEKIDVLTHVTQYHESVGQLRSEFDKLAVLLAENDHKQAFEKFSALFRNHFQNHFRYEEEVVFPALLAWKKTLDNRSMIDTYVSIHHRLLLTGAEILNVFSREGETPPEDRTTEILVLLERLYDGIIKHAEDENRNLVPLVSNNPTLRFLTGRNFAVFRAKLDREKH